MHTRTLPRHALTGVPAVGWRKPRSGEDPHGLYPIWPILGAAEDDDTDDTDDTDQDDDVTVGDAEDDDTGEGDGGTTDDDGDDADPEGADALGDKGKKALDAMKARLRKERERRRTAEAKVAEKTGTDDQDPEHLRAEAERTATAKANQRIIRSEVKAAAKGRLANPGDALVFLDLDRFEVDDDGQVDEDDLADAIEELLKTRPYLAAAPAKRFQGTGDGGAQRKAGRPKQLTENDLKTMTPEQIVKAQDAGQLDDLLGRG